MDHLEEKLEKAAKQMEDYFRKSDEMKKLLETIEKLGPEGLKKALPNLSVEQRTLLIEVLKKGKPAVSMDDKMPEGGVKVRQVQSEKVKAKGHDDEDEELVKEEAAEHKHQGDSSPEGFSGQKIEDPPSEDKGKQDKSPGPDPVKKGEEIPKQDEVEKAQAVGAGARGGQVLGYTRSGKPIYAGADHSAHAGYNSEEKEDVTEHQKKVDAVRRKLHLKDHKQDIPEKKPERAEKSETATTDLKKGEYEESKEDKKPPFEQKDSEQKDPKQDQEEQKDPKEEGEEKPQQDGKQQYSDDILQRMIQGMKARGMQRGQAMEKFYHNGYSMDKMYKMWDGMDSEPEAKKEDTVEMPKKEFKEEHERLVGVLESPSREDDKEEAGKQKKELKEEVKKSEELPLAVESSKGLLQSPLVIKPESKEMAPPLTGKPPANAGGQEGEEMCKGCGKGKSDCVCKERKEEQKEIKVMEKSVKWKPKNLLIASTRRGQNAHYEVADLIEKGEKQLEDLKKSNSYYQDPYQEPLVKSESAEPKATNVNDLIEKGADMNQTDAEAIVRLKKGGEPKFNTKSFTEEEMIKSLSPVQFKAAQDSLKKK